MHLSDYADDAIKFAAYPDEAKVLYPLLALTEEVGELNGKIAKMLRKDSDGLRSISLGDCGDLGLSRDEDNALRAEAGDILWQFSALCKGMGWSLEDIARENLDKLEARRLAGTIVGEGDNR